VNRCRTWRAAKLQTEAVAPLGRTADARVGLTAHADAVAAEPANAAAVAVTEAVGERGAEDSARLWRHENDGEQDERNNHQFIQ
jgi:hypothetical protein